MNLIGRILLILAIAIAGIYCLPDGSQRLEYILFKLFPQAKINLPQRDLSSEQFSSNNENDDKNLTVKVDIPEQKSNVKTTAKLHKKRQAIKNVIGKNYLDSVLSAGQLERWNPRTFPLKVYIQADASIPTQYIEEIKRAFTTWESGTNGFVRFVYTNSSIDANYKCIFSSNLKNRNCDERGMGTSAYQYFTYDKNGSIQYSIVELSVMACNGKYWPPEQFYSMALHEIGHGLGLRGHSTNSEDLMYPVGASTLKRATISTADMNTLRAVYSIIPDVTNIPFSEDDKKGLITTADYWGEGDTRANFTIDKIKQNINITSENPSLYVELAHAYRDKKDYQSAINAYSQALKKIDNPETASAVLLDVSVMYIEIGKLQSAEKCLNKAYSYGTSDDMANIYNTLGVKYAEQKDYNKALQIFDKTLSVTNNDEIKQMVYKNCRWVAYSQKDKILFDKYNKLIKK